MLCKSERLMNLEEFLLSILDCARIFEYISDIPSVLECLKPQLWSPQSEHEAGMGAEVTLLGSQVCSSKCK